MDNAIEIKGLTKKFGDKTVLKNVNMTVKPREIYAFLGANGAGKTTLMKLLFGILKADEGQISLLGKSINPTGSNPIFQKIGNIIETPVFYNGLSATENLQVHCDYLGTTQYKQDIKDILLLVGLSDTSGKQVGEFSLGMKQRLALGRALIGKPDLLVLDEPINGLDPMGISDTRDLLLSINREMGTAILISSHIISEIDKIADTVGIIDTGEMLEEKALKEIKNNTDSLETYFKQVVYGGGRHD